MSKAGTSRTVGVAAVAALAAAMVSLPAQSSAVGEHSQQADRGGHNAHAFHQEQHANRGERVAAVREASGSYTVSWSRAGRHAVWASRSSHDPSRTGRLVGVSGGRSLSVQGLANDARWYFEVARTTAHRKPRHGWEGHPRDGGGVVVSTRGVGLDSTTNTRDLGGYRTTDGRSVRWGLIFRSDAITEPTSRDVAILAGMRLRHAVDFRGEAEIEKDGPNQLAPSVHRHAVPLLDATTTALSDAIQAVLASGDPTAAEELLGDGKAEEIAATGPTNMMSRETTPEAFGSVLTLLASHRGAPLIFNCTAGKDRTGVFAAVLLRVLGVPERTVLADYVLSNQYRAAYNEATYDFLASAGIDIALIRPLMEQKAENLAAMFRSIEESYGSFGRFVHEGLGLDRHTVATLRGKYLV